MNYPAHKTEGVNRIQTMRFYPFVFTGNAPRKGNRAPLNQINCSEERDEETGYGYFGARYMDHELMTMWLSVDPMAGKYPSISPYAYCAWNPVKLVDPDGRKIWIYNYDGKGTNLRFEPGKTRPMGTKAAQEQIRSLNRMAQTDAGWKLIYRMDKLKDNFYISNKSTGTPQTSATTACSDGAMLKMNGNNDIRSIAHELFHAFQINQDGTGDWHLSQQQQIIDYIST